MQSCLTISRNGWFKRPNGNQKVFSHNHRMFVILLWQYHWSLRCVNYKSRISPFVIELHNIKMSAVFDIILKYNIFHSFSFIISLICMRVYKNVSWHWVMIDEKYAVIKHSLTMQCLRKILTLYLIHYRISLCIYHFM